MTVDEIKSALKAMGWTQAMLAEKLRVHPGTVKNILSGQTKLTDQLAAHIELLLKDQQEQLLIFKVSYPDALCERWVPGWERLTEEQRVQAVEAVLQSAAEQLAADYERTLAPEERAMIRQLLGGLRGPSHVFDLDEEAAQTLAPEEKVMADYVEQCKAAAHLGADELREMERLQVAPVVPAAAAGVKRAEAKGERSLEEKFAAVTKQYSRVVRQEGDRVVVEFGAGPDPSLLKKKKPFVRRGGHKGLKWDFSESGKKQD